MPITPDDVDHVAELARLSFDASEKEQLASEMSRILDYIDTLNELDTAGVPPMAHGLDLKNVTRADAPNARISKEQALQNAPDTDGEHMRVPRVIGNDA
ncbi:MAG: Asp-tRNA(Asn)/Glu-tRNA(Gln) amidotransferase subunit GatC [Longimonas sp.]|uniref:Asp-tRNA(Asn)/Glu-tRNA(Gln) amidotransferase subunit GatC n=1 Tax=Longimonas sp. TaxID=2039626 RepID=UPI003974E9E5